MNSCSCLDVFERYCTCGDFCRQIKLSNHFNIISINWQNELIQFSHVLCVPFLQIPCGGKLSKTMVVCWQFIAAFNWAFLFEFVTSLKFEMLKFELEVLEELEVFIEPNLKTCPPK